MSLPKVHIGLWGNKPIGNRCESGRVLNCYSRSDTCFCSFPVLNGGHKPLSGVVSVICHERHAKDMPTCAYTEESFTSLHFYKTVKTCLF